MELNKYDASLAQLLDLSPVNLEHANPLLELVALSRGMNIMRYTPQFFLVQHPRLRTPFGFAGSKSTWTGLPTRQISDDKELTRRFFENNGVRVPGGRVFDDGRVRDAVKYAESLDTPVVVKPRNGGHGTGVMTNLRGGQEVEGAIRALHSTKYGGKPFIVEEYVSGDDYRVLVVGDTVVSVVLRRPCSVLGDGRSSIEELIVKENAVRLQNPHARKALIKLGDDAQHWIEKQGLTPASVPSGGHRVRLGSAGNVAAGGDSIEVLDETDSGLIQWAIDVVRSMPGLDHAGIDVIGDHTRSPGAKKPVLIEVNPNPAWTIHVFPIYGRPRNVVDGVFLRSCRLADFDPQSSEPRVVVRCEISGAMDGEGYEEWFTEFARTRDVTGSIRWDAPGRMTAEIDGRTADVWALTSSAIAGPRGTSVHLVETTHVSGVATADGFGGVGK